MIVICTKCQAKFRVADDKIGARGAKVRCSKCQTVFLVRPEGAPAPAAPPASGVELEPRAPSPPVENPFVTAPVRWDPAAPSFPTPVPGASGAGLSSLPEPSADPFAPASPSPSGDPFARAADPFAPTAAGAAAPADPFAAAPSADPFAAAPSADPFAPPQPSGSVADPFAASAPPADVGALLGQAAGAAPPSAAALAEAPEADPDDVQSVTSGIALEERSATPPRPASSAPFDLSTDAGYDGFAGGAQAFDPSALDLGAPSEPPPPVSRPDTPLELAAAAPVAPVLAAAAAPRTAEAPPAPEARADAHERVAGRPSRLRGVAVNALALAAVLGAAIVILALWRAEGPLDAAALRPSAVLAALRRGGAEAPFAARDVRSGLYERENAPPVLFVRGSVVSRAAAPVARVQVRVEVVRGGAVVARGEALAGAVPTAEELWGARDAAALAAVTSAAAARAPAAVRPGDAVPFLVAIADPPADLAGASLRVEASPAGSASP